MNINKALFPLNRGFSAISSMQDRMSSLQVQLATGKRHATLSGLGSNTSYDLTIRARQGQVEAYQSNIKMVNLRLDFMDQSLSRLDAIEAESRSAVASGGAGSDGTNMVSAQSLAHNRLDEVVTLLNSEVNGRYLFGGSASDKAPVASLDAILNGQGGRDGFQTVVGERKAADAGADGRGRLTNSTLPATASSALGGAVDGTELLDSAEIGFANGQTITLGGGGFAGVNISFTVGGGATTGAVLDISATTIDDLVLEINTQAGASIASVSGGEIVITGQDLVTPITSTGTAPIGLAASSDPDLSTVRLSEDGAHPFGYKLSAISTSSAAVTTTTPSGTPSALSVQFTGAPMAGETVNLGLTLPDGTSHTVTFRAVSGAPGGPGQFQIGATPDATAANFQTAMNDELLRMKTGVLEASSVYAASDNFFNGRGETIMRVDGPPFDTATSLIAATPTNTVSWYTGEDSTGASRQTVRARVDDSTVVDYGVQANETGLRDLVRSLAALAVEDYPPGDTNAVERYTEMSTRQTSRLSELNNNQSGSIELISLDLGIARSTIGNATARHSAYGSQLETLLSDIESAPIEEVAAEILALQTRLEASYQTTAIVAQLTLVNFIG